MDHLNLFATPVFVFALDGVAQLNQRLVHALRAESRKNPAGPGDHAGWRSPPDLGRRGDACYRVLMEVFANHVQRVFQDMARQQGIVPKQAYQCSLHAWATIMGPGHYAPLRSHVDAHWSAVYYADAGDADMAAYPHSGALAFVNPGRGDAPIAGLNVFPNTITVPPKTGTLVVFPGWLQHYVHPYCGIREHISVWCNAHIEPAYEQR